MRKAEGEIIMQMTTENDLIRRNTAIYQACNWRVSPDSEVYNAIREAIRSMIERAPAVDAIEVVRCKSCRFYAPVPGFEHGDPYCPKIGIYPEPNFFCRDGKRRDD